MPAYLFLDLDETLIVAKARLNKLSEAASQALDLTEEFKYGQENDIFYRIHVDTHNWLFSYLAQTPTDNLVVWIFTDGTYQEVFIKYMLSQMYSVFSTIQYRINFANINTFKIAVQNSDGKYKVKRIRNKIDRIEKLIHLKKYSAIPESYLLVDDNDFLRYEMRASGMVSVNPKADDYPIKLKIGLMEIIALQRFKMFYAGDGMPESWV